MGIRSRHYSIWLFRLTIFKKNHISSVAEVLEFKMRTSLTRLAKGFGELATIRGTTRYHMSPFEQRALAGIISHAIPNTLWRIKCSVMYVLPPAILGYVVYDTVEKEHDRLQRKQPGQFDHEIVFICKIFCFVKSQKTLIGN